MAITDPPRWRLDSTAISSRKGVRVLLHNPDPIPLVLPIEVGAQAITLAGGSWASGEGARALFCRTRKAHVIHLGLVYYLDERQPTPVSKLNVQCCLEPVCSRLEHDTL